MLNLNRYIRYALTRFRFGVSDINADELKSPLCLSAVDNEVHFVLCCPTFDDLRYEFIVKIFQANIIKHSADGIPCYREEPTCKL